MKNELIQEFEQLSKPLIKWLNDNQDPHTKIIIDCVSAEVVSGKMVIHTEEFIND